MKVSMQHTFTTNIERVRLAVGAAMYRLVATMAATIKDAIDSCRWAEILVPEENGTDVHLGPWMTVDGVGNQKTKTRIVVLRTPTAWYGALDIQVGRTRCARQFTTSQAGYVPAREAATQLQRSRHLPQL